jgi:hypothetical protein
MKRSLLIITWHTIVTILLFSLCQVAAFGDFFDFFHKYGHDDDDGGSHKKASKSSPKVVECENYLCTVGKVCVDNPIDCPCDLNEVKCRWGNDWYFCARNDITCPSIGLKEWK